MHTHTDQDSDAFLLKEYESANDLTFAVDELRNKISSFYGTFVTVALAGLGLFVKSGTATAREQLGWSLPVVLLATGVVGVIVVMALARLRAAQLEHFRIINKVRKHFLGDDVALWNVVELSGATLPMPNRRSGSYMWALMVMFLSATLISAAAFVAVTQWFIGPVAWAITLVVFAFALTLEDAIYLRRAAPRAHQDYAAAP